MIELTRHPQDTKKEAVPLTWDYAARYHHTIYKHDLVLATCLHGHTCRLVATRHSIASDGTISPSYVCPLFECSFHATVRLLGWDPYHVLEEPNR